MNCLSSCWYRKAAAFAVAYRQTICHFALSLTHSYFSAHFCSTVFCEFLLHCKLWIPCQYKLFLNEVWWLILCGSCLVCRWICVITCVCLRVDPLWVWSCDFASILLLESAICGNHWQIVQIFFFLYACALRYSRNWIDELYNWNSLWQIVIVNWSGDLTFKFNTRNSIVILRSDFIIVCVCAYNQSSLDQLSLKSLQTQIK